MKLWTGKNQLSVIAFENYRNIIPIRDIENLEKLGINKSIQSSSNRESAIL